MRKRITSTAVDGFSWIIKGGTEEQSKYCLNSSTRLEYARGGMSREEGEMVRDHIKNCSYCRGLVHSEIRLWEAEQIQSKSITQELINLISTQITELIVQLKKNSIRSFLPFLQRYLYPFKERIYLRHYGSLKFSVDEFKAPKTPEALIKAISAKSKIEMPIDDTPIDKLNKLLQRQDLYKAMAERPNEVKDSIRELECGHKFSPGAISYLNRILLEANYPNETPKAYRYTGIYDYSGVTGLHFTEKIPHLSQVGYSSEVAILLLTKKKSFGHTHSVVWLYFTPLTDPKPFSVILGSTWETKTGRGRTKSRYHMLPKKLKVKPTISIAKIEIPSTILWEEVWITIN